MVGHKGPSALEYFVIETGPMQPSACPPMLWATTNNCLILMTNFQCNEGRTWGVTCRDFATSARKVSVRRSTKERTRSRMAGAVRWQSMPQTVQVAALWERADGGRQAVFRRCES